MHILLLLLLLFDGDDMLQIRNIIHIYIYICDNVKLLNLRDKKFWTNMWGLLFSVYLQLCD